ncbi:hypothetical protein D3C85_1489650 [compost metagenome]
MFNSVNMPCSLMISSVVPDNTQCNGLFIDANEIEGEVNLTTSFQFKFTASILPGFIFCINSARFETKRSASSNEITPDKQAATYSPILCPINASG